MDAKPGEIEITDGMIAAAADAAWWWLQENGPPEDENGHFRGLSEGEIARMQRAALEAALAPTQG